MVPDWMVPDWMVPDWVVGQIGPGVETGQGPFDASQQQQGRGHPIHRQAGAQQQPGQLHNAAWQPGQDQGR